MEKKGKRSRKACSGDGGVQWSEESNWHDKKGMRS